jgi:kynurenine formamidase
MPVVSDVVDLSMPFFEGMPCDDLGPKIWNRLSFAASRQLYQHTQSREGRVFLTTDHVGTHLDGPLRFDPKGSPIEQVPLERFILPARQIDLRAVGRSGLIGARDLERAAPDLAIGEAAVLWTGHDLHWKHPDYFWNRPQLAPDGADWLAERRPGIVAADFPGIGKPADDRFEVKRRLHRAGIMTAEQLMHLDRVAGRRWHLFCGPLRIRGTAGSLLRAVALVDWRAREIVDLTLDTFPGMPALGAVPTYWTRANHDLTRFFYKGELSYQTNSMMLTEHAGTHLDVPYHFKEDGPAVHEVPVDKLLVRARVFDFSDKKPLDGIGPEDFERVARRDGIEIEPGDGAVVYTEHSRNYYASPQTYGDVRPFITKEGAEWVARHKPGIVITDLVGLDEPADQTTPVHNIVLHSGVCMLQVLTNLKHLTKGEWYVGAFAINVVQGTGSPVRAFAARA